MSRRDHVRPALSCCVAGVVAVSLASSAPPVTAGTGGAPGAASSRAAAPPADALHVATSGHDRASGSRRSPLRSIGEAVDRARRGDTIVVHSGTYHESIELEGPTDVTLRAARGAVVWLDGSRRVTSWSRGGSAWVSTGWTAEFDASPTYTWGAPDGEPPYWQFVDPAHPMAAHPDQVWIDDVPQAQVASVDEVRRGAFFVDEAADRLYLGSDPAGREVRASTIAKAISVRVEGTRIRGIGVRRYANSVPHMGAVTVEAPGVRLTDMTIRENATGGLHVMEPRVRLRRLTLAANGMMGMTATGADHLRASRLRVVGNNRERFNPTPAAGGAKIGRGVDAVVHDSVFRRNRGTGLWFDESVYRIRVIGSRLTHNAGHGLSLELSGTVLVAGNVFARNRRNGVKVNDTDTVALWNNTFTGNRRELDVVQDDRDLDPQGSHLDPSLPLTFRNGPVRLRNNVIARTSRGSGCLLCVEDHSGRMSAEDMRVTARGNVYQRPSVRRPRVLVLWSRGVGATPFRTFRDFRRTTGQERPGRAFTGVRVLRRDNRVTRRIRRLARRIAQPLPADVADELGAARRSRFLGAG